MSNISVLLKTLKNISVKTVYFMYYLEQQEEMFPERDIALEFSKIFSALRNHKRNSIHLCCTGVEAESSEDDISISVSLQIKPKLSLWLNITGGNTFVIWMN